MGLLQNGSSVSVVDFDHQLATLKRQLEGDGNSILIQNLTGFISHPNSPVKREFIGSLNMIFKMHSEKALKVDI